MRLKELGKTEDGFDCAISVALKDGRISSDEYERLRSF